MANLTRRQRYARILGENIKKVRRTAGLTLDDIEKRTDINIGNLSKMERGVIIPRLDTADKLAQGLGVKLHDLLPGRNTE